MSPFFVHIKATYCCRDLFYAIFIKIACDYSVLTRLIHCFTNAAIQRQRCSVAVRLSLLNSKTELHRSSRSCCSDSRRGRRLSQPSAPMTLTIIAKVADRKFQCSYYYRATHMHSAGYAVRPFVYPSVTFMYCTGTTQSNNGGL